MSPVPSTDPFTVLCVDDEPSILRLVLDLLGAAGYRVLIAQSADRALKIVGQTAVDSVVLDYSMPGMDGLALAIEIKRIDPEMPVVVFSASPEQIPGRLRQLAHRVVDKGSPLQSLTAALKQVRKMRRTFHGVRAHARYKVELRVLLTPGEKVKPGVFWINARSLGEGGIGAEVPVALKEGDTVLLDLMFRDEILTLPASVRYHTGAFHGFQFIDISSEQRNAIRQYCQAAS